MSYPKAVVFDLDYTLWREYRCWCDTHIFPPIRAVSKTTIEDIQGTKLSFYQDVAKIIAHLKSKDVYIISASRTSTPGVAEQMLTHLHIDDKPAVEYFDSLQWGTFTKKKHIQRAAKELNIEPHEMVLCDDELRNMDVEEIGVHFIHVEDGLTLEVFMAGLAGYQGR